MTSRKLLVVGALLLCTLSVPSCDSQNKSEVVQYTPESLDLYRLRNIGRLQAERDTNEGYLEATLTYEKVVTQSPDSFLDRLNLIRAQLFTIDRIKQAKEHVEKAYQLADANGVSKLDRADLDYLAGLYYKKGAYDDAKAYAAFVRASEVHTNEVNVWYQRGYVAESLNDRADAEVSYRAAMKLDPDHRALHYRLGQILVRTNRGDEGAELMQRSAELSEKDTEKCPLTKVTLRRPNRSEAEAPPVAFSWSKVPTPSWIGDVSGAVEVVRANLDGDRRDDLLLLTKSGYRVAAHGGSARHVTQEQNGFVFCASADLDNNELADSVFVRSDGTLSVEWSDAEKTSLVSLPGVATGATQAYCFDIDHDNDLDIVTVQNSTVTVVRNNGDRKFERLPSSFSQSVLGRSRAALSFHDLDQANDLDLVTTGTDGARAWLNLRDGTFKEVVLPEFAGYEHVIVEDFNADGAPDLFACGGKSGYRYAFNQDRLGVPVQFRLGSSIAGTDDFPGKVTAVALADIDNDCDADILLATDKGGFHVLQNRVGQFVGVPTGLPENVSGIAITTAEINGDQHLDVLLTTADGSLEIYQSGATPSYASWKLLPYGQTDNNDSIGVVLDHHVDVLYESRMIREPGGLRLGLGQRSERTDGVRMRWPAGIIHPATPEDLKLDNGFSKIPQRPGASVSCPFLYVNGPNGWEFVSDVVAIAPLAEWLPEGQQPVLDPEEFVRIPGELLTPKDGKLQMLITEELKEITYLDRVDLVLVDHPEGTELWLDESTRQGAYDPLVVTLFDADDLYTPRVFDRDGEDITEKLDEKDRSYHHPYEIERTQWYGWVPPHTFDLVDERGAAFLLLTGRVYWYDSTVSYSMAQRGEGWGPFSLTRLIGEGATPVVADLGVPAGMDRTMVVSLPESAPGRMRLTGHHQFLWNRVRLATAGETVTIGDYEANEFDGRRTLSDGTALSYQRLYPTRADLGYHGFSKVDGPKALHEQTYLPKGARPVDWFPRSTGNATRYGDVLELVEEHDDHLVVVIPGDKVELDFAAPEEPAEGMTRTGFLRVSGWAKENGYHVRTGNRIEPLPYREMQQYPPSSQPTHESYRDYLKKYQTRQIRW